MERNIRQLLITQGDVNAGREAADVLLAGSLKAPYSVRGSAEEHRPSPNTGRRTAERQPRTSERL